MIEIAILVEIVVTKLLQPSRIQPAPRPIDYEEALFILCDTERRLQFASVFRSFPQSKLLWNGITIIVLFHHAHSFTVTFGIITTQQEESQYS